MRECRRTEGHRSPSCSGHRGNDGLRAQRHFLKFIIAYPDLRGALASSLHEQSLSPEPESGFGSGLRSALGGAEPDGQGASARAGEPETEGGFGSGLRRALERHEGD